MCRVRVPLALLAVAILAASLTGCSSSGSNARALEAHEWKITRLGTSAYSGTADITAKFSAGKLSGSTGVNLYNATYDAKSGNNIAITLGTMTLRAGTPEAMQAESAYLAALKAAVSYAVDDSSLTLFDKGGVSVVEYAVDVPTPLVGTTWNMTAYNNGKGGFQSAVSSATVTAVFGQDGTLSGNGGVNQYHSTYKTSGSSITIQPPATTRMAGPPDLDAQETAYLAALAKATTYAIEGKELMLRDATGASMAGYQAK